MIITWLFHWKNIKYAGCAVIFLFNLTQAIGSAAKKTMGGGDERKPKEAYNQYLCEDEISGKILVFKSFPDGTKSILKT